MLAAFGDREREFRGREEGERERERWSNTIEHPSAAATAAVVVVVVDERHLQHRRTILKSINTMLGGDL